jgi:hypothetical protein
MFTPAVVIAGYSVYEPGSNCPCGSTHNSCMESVFEVKLSAVLVCSSRYVLFPKWDTVSVYA